MPGSPVSTASISTRAFGRSAQTVSIVGLGGEGILRTHGQENRAVAVIQEAIDSGICYFDCARAYAGSEGYYGLIWPERPADRSRIFQTSKSAMRDKAGALADLDRTLKTMGIDHLDLWQIHDVRTEEDLSAIAGPKGALEAFLEAKATGKARFIGVTGHHDPFILTRAVREWPVDAVLMPVNPIEVILGGFLDETLAAANEKGLAVIGMKVLGASRYLSPRAGLTAERLIRFALSQPITTAIVGCSTAEEVKTLAGIGKTFHPLTNDEHHEIVKLFRPYARQLAYYRGAI